MASIMQNSNFSRSSSSRDSASRRGSESDASYPSTAPTSIAGSPRLGGDTKVMHMPPPSSPPRYVRYVDDEQYQYLPASHSQRTHQPTAQQTLRQTPRQYAYQPASYDRKQAFESYRSCETFEDLSPSTSVCPRASSDTHMSLTDTEDDSGNMSESTLDDDDSDEDDDSQKSSDSDDDLDRIPPLPDYCHDIVDSNVQPCTPHEFARLFPSLNRISIRHDEFTADGNMNLRVDMTVPRGNRRRPTSYQLFHLRMYDLAKREFSLRRYGRDSGREVCNAKLADLGEKQKQKQQFKLSKKAKKSSPTSANDFHSNRSSSSSSSSGSSPSTRPTLQRSMSSALRSLGMGGGAGAGKASLSSPRPSTSHSRSSYDADGGSDELHHPVVRVHSCASAVSGTSERPSAAHAAASPPKTLKPRAVHDKNKIKLEFSNYARVDVERRRQHSHSPSSSVSASSGNTAGYEFAWWGHKYYWKRVPEKHLDVVHFHLMRRDERGNETAVAHIVPETRSPNQVKADEEAGGWIPPCHFWISDPSVLAAMTDVADVIMATGLMALVDDCIRTRWHAHEQPARKAGYRLGMPLMHNVFHRRTSSSNSTGGNNKYMSSPLRNHQPVAAY